MEIPELDNENLQYLRSNPFHTAHSSPNQPPVVDILLWMELETMHYALAVSVQYKNRH